MPSVHLTEEEVQPVLRRAIEIADSTPAEEVREGVSLESLYAAAEEAGVPRGAVELALRERLHVTPEQLQPGQRLFAPSADGHCYPATLVSVSETSATVRFENGGEHICRVWDLQQFSLVPGRKLEYNDKTWGWWGCEVVEYNEKKGLVTVYEGWSRKKVDLTKIRIPRVKTKQERRISSIVARTAFIAGSLGLGAGWLLHTLVR